MKASTFFKCWGFFIGATLGLLFKFILPQSTTAT